jgi:hypothetical protein
MHFYLPASASCVLGSQVCLTTSGFRPSLPGYFGDGGLVNFLPRLALNLDAPYVSHLRSWEYRRELSRLAALYFCIKLNLFQYTI